MIGTKGKTIHIGEAKFTTKDVFDLTDSYSKNQRKCSGILKAAAEKNELSNYGFRIKAADKKINQAGLDLLDPPNNYNSILAADKVQYHVLVSKQNSTDDLAEDILNPWRKK